MRKKILIVIGVVLVVLIAGVLYLNDRNRTLSPPGETTASYEEFLVSVAYSRPSVRDRLIFGTKEEGALLPHGIYWRLGANEPTRISVNQDFLFGSKVIPTGTYDMYAVPEDGQMKIRLNEGNRFWGYTEPDYEKDIAEVSVPMRSSKISVEQYTITAIDENGGINLVFMWSDKIWELQLNPR